MSYQVINPFIQFVDQINGKPLSGGSVYFGRQDSDPKNQPSNRINVYAVQDNGTEVLLAQPITLNGAGQPQYSGSVKQIKVELYTGENAYCVQVFGSSGSQKGYSARVYPALDSISGVSISALADPNSSVSIAGKTASTIAKSLSWLTPEMFGAVGDGSTDDYQALSLMAAACVDGSCVIFSAQKKYLIKGQSRVTFTADNLVVYGFGAEVWAENSASKDTVGGGAFYSGLTFTGDNTKVFGLTWRGSFMAAQSPSYFTAAFCRGYNLHNAAWGIVEGVAFKKYLFTDSVFEYSLDTDAGNYTAIQRGGTYNAATQAGLVEVKSCTFRGTSGGVNIHNCKRVVVENIRADGVHVNAVKTDEGVQEVVLTGRVDGAATFPLSPNRHLNTPTFYAYFMASGQQSINLNLSMHNMTNLGGIYFTDTTTQTNTIGTIKARNCTVPVLDRMGGNATIELDIENCTSPSVRVGATVGVWVNEQTFTGKIVNSGVLIGNSAYNSVPSTVVWSCNIESSAAGPVITAVDTSPTPPYELDYCIIKDCVIKVNGGAGISGVSGSFVMLVSDDVVINGAATPHTGQAQKQYINYGLSSTSAMPAIPIGRTLRLLNSSAGVVLTLADSSWIVGDEISIVNASAGNCSISCTTGLCDGFATVQLTAGASVTIAKQAANIYRTIAQFGTVNRL